MAFLIGDVPFNACVSELVLTPSGVSSRKENGRHLPLGENQCIYIVSVAEQDHLSTDIFNYDPEFQLLNQL